MAIGTGAAIIGSSVLGAVSSNNASSKAAKAQQRATDQSIGEQRRQYDQNRKDMMPWRDAGVNALNQYEGMIGQDAGAMPEFNNTTQFNFDLQADQGYNFARDEAIKATNRAAGAQGEFNSGNRLAAIADRVTGVASQFANDAYSRQLGQSKENYGRDLTNYGIKVDRNKDLYGRGQDQMNRFASLANVGQTTSNAMANMGTQNSNAIGSYLTNNAANQGNLAMNNAANINNAFQSGASNWMLNNYLKKKPGVA